MRIKADLVLRAGSEAYLRDGRLTAPAWALLPGSRVYLPNSREIVKVVAGVVAQRECDAHPCVLSAGDLYEVVAEVEA